MFKIQGNTFHVTRGDGRTVELSFRDYTFPVGAEIHFRIYEEEGMNKEPVLDKEVDINTATETAEIEFLGADTALGNPINERTTYWYEIAITDDQTPVCFDENGPKLFYLYPGGNN